MQKVTTTVVTTPNVITALNVINLLHIALMKFGYYILRGDKRLPNANLRQKIKIRNSDQVRNSWYKITHYKYENPSNKT